MIAAVLVRLTFAAALAATVFYFLSFRKNSKWLTYARLSFHASVTGVLISAAFLLFLILTHQFQYTYVWNYSSMSLPTPLLISTFYAGQEGSFMLWTVYTAVIGVFLMGYSVRKGYEASIMAVYSLIQVFLLLMLVVKNPFELVWETFPGQVESGFVPANGRGLNPLLQNFWMVIHPPILFAGFSAMAVPYAFAVAAMLKRDYRDWIRPATPWIAFGVLALGTGIILGGYWAYETLGWGGYWGWDPVENSSLIPWLAGLALLHTILSQRQSGAFIRLNLLLGMSPFLLVLYSTFLTRSGVLGDTSVHSFVDPGMWVYWLLVGCIVLFAGLGLSLFLRRIKEMPRQSIPYHYLSREFALFLGASALCFAAILVLLGTSAPLLTGLLGSRPAAIDVSFYPTTTLPIAIAVALLSGLGQLLWWNRCTKETLLRSMRIPFGGAVISTLVLIVFGTRDAAVILFVSATFFTLLVNVIVGYRIFQGNPRLAGGAVAHIGLALLFLGFVGSAKYDDKQTVSLVQGKPVEALGYTLTYVGYTPIDKEKFSFNVHVEKDGKAYRVSPVMYYSDFNDGLMRNPDIVNMYTRDFYVAPLSLEPKGDQNAGQTVSLRKGEQKQVEGISVRFVDFDFSAVQKGAMLTGEAFSIGVILEVRQVGKIEQIVPKMINNQGKVSYEPASSINSEYRFTIVSMKPNQSDPNQSSVEIGVAKPGNPDSEPQRDADTLIVEASVKPYINFVWMGTVTVLVGFAMTIVRRVKEAKSRRSDSMVGSP